MGKRKDRKLIAEAADSWLSEMLDYIIPDVQTKEERKSYRKQANKLGAAIARENQRAEARRVRDVDR